MAAPNSAPRPSRLLRLRNLDLVARVGLFAGLGLLVAFYQWGALWALVAPIFAALTGWQHSGSGTDPTAFSPMVDGLFALALAAFGLARGRAVWRRYRYTPLLAWLTHPQRARWGYGPNAESAATEAVMPDSAAGTAASASPDAEPSAAAPLPETEAQPRAPRWWQTVAQALAARRDGGGDPAADETDPTDSAAPRSGAARREPVARVTRRDTPLLPGGDEEPH